MNISLASLMTGKLTCTAKKLLFAFGATFALMLAGVVWNGAFGQNSNVTINTVPAANLQTDISYGRFPNGTGPYVFFASPTPNAVNAVSGFSEALDSFLS